jgi:hypothetical protein
MLAIQAAITWSRKDWKTVEYKADVTATGSHEVANRVLLKEFNLSGDYEGQARAWKWIRDLARQGAENGLTPDIFLTQRQKVYCTFGLPIPTRAHHFARYNTLRKWAEHPEGYPDLSDFGTFKTHEANKVLAWTDDLRRISCRKWDPQPLYRQPALYSSRIHVLLSRLNQDSEPLLRQFRVWFGDEEGGFASTLIFHLREKVDVCWKECWHPQMHLVGSARHLTSLYGADLDMVIELNPHPDDAITFCWSKEKNVTNVKLKGQNLESKQTLTLCKAFFDAYENKRTQAHPQDNFELKSAKEPRYTRARLTFFLGNSTVDLIPALRGTDGSFLYFGNEGDQGKLVYSNGSEALRIIAPYREWNHFLDVVRCMKLLFKEDWNTKHPKVYGCMSETLAVDIALELGRKKWENSSFIDLLHACLDKIVWYLNAKQPLPALNEPSADLLPARGNQELVAQLLETIKEFKGLTEEQIVEKIQAVIDRHNLNLE